MTRIGFKFFFLVFSEYQTRTGLELEYFPSYFDNFLRDIEMESGKEVDRPQEVWDHGHEWGQGCRARLGLGGGEPYWLLLW